MKNLLKFIVLSVILLTACNSEKKESNKNETSTTYVSFGEKIDVNNAISKEEMASKFQSLAVGDTLNVKFTTKVDEVCQTKGCWIKVSLEDGKQSFVKFKDYAFFMPFNAAGSEVVLNGKAFKNEVSVKELQHYAKDAGKSVEEIAKITEPKVTYSFVADGVLLEAKADE